MLNRLLVLIAVAAVYPSSVVAFGRPHAATWTDYAVIVAVVFVVVEIIIRRRQALTS